MALELVSPGGDRRLALKGPATIMVGRDPVSDLSIPDPAVSRRHAEMRLETGAPHVHVTDLGSRNGTWINGTRITRATAKAGDTVAFGTVVFTILERIGATPRPWPAPTLAGSGPRRRERPIPSREQALADVAGTDVGAPVRLAQLAGVALRVATATGLDRVLETVVEEIRRVVRADRATILLTAPDGTLVPRLLRERAGATPRPMPLALASEVAARQIALRTEDAHPAPPAMAAPLLSEALQPLGVLYVEQRGGAQDFEEADLTYLVALAGIAAAAIERDARVRTQEQSARVRGQLARHFPPALAERLAAGQVVLSPGVVLPGVVVMGVDRRDLADGVAPLPPARLTARLNGYIARLAECVFRHDGAFEQGSSEMFVAYWGVPNRSTDDATRALAAAMAMQEELRQLNAEWRRDGLPEVQVAIGLHIGEALLAEVGPPLDRDLRLMGESVRLATRLGRLAAGGEVLGTAAFCSALPADTERQHRDDRSLASTSDPTGRVWQLRGTAP